MRQIRFRPALKIMSVSAGHFGISVVARVWATLPLPASDAMSSPSTNVSPLLCVFWLPGSEEILSVCHEALYKKKKISKAHSAALSIPLMQWPRTVWLTDEKSPWTLCHHASHLRLLFRFQHHRYPIDCAQRERWMDAECHGCRRSQEEKTLEKDFKVRR